MASIVNLSIDQGADFARVLTISDSAGAPIDLTGYVFAAQARLNYGDVSAIFQFLFSIRTQAGLDIGKVDMTLQDTTTAALTLLEATRYVYDVEMDDGTGFKQRLFQGTITLNPEATKI